MVAQHKKKKVMKNIGKKVGDFFTKLRDVGEKIWDGVGKPVVRTFAKQYAPTVEALGDAAFDFSHQFDKGPKVGGRGSSYSDYNEDDFL